MELIKKFDEIYHNNYNKVFTLIYTISDNWSLAEDITQETFLKAYTNIDSLREETKLPLWLSKIAYNLFLDFKRKNHLKITSIDDHQLELKLTDFKKSINTEIEQKAMAKCIQNKLMLLPENYRLPLLLDIQGYSNPEKADILGCTLENAKIRLHRARKKIKEILGKECVFYYDERNVLC